MEEKKDEYIVVWDSFDGNGFSPYVYKNGEITNITIPIKTSLSCIDFYERDIHKLLAKNKIKDFTIITSVIGIYANYSKCKECREYVKKYCNLKWKKTKRKEIEQRRRLFSQMASIQDDYRIWKHQIKSFRKA